MNSSFSGNNRNNYSSQRNTTTTSSSSSSLKNYNFDFAIGSTTRTSSSNRPLKDQKNPSPSPPPSTTSWNAALNKPSWTHQPAPAARSGLSNPSFSMVGDIFGKSWTSNAAAPGIGLPKADPNLFGDLLGSALGQGKSAGNVPLKDAAPRRNAFSMGNLSDSLPKTTTTASAAAATGAMPMMTAAFGSAGNSMGGAKIGTPLGGPAMKSSASAATSAPASNQKTDPFGSLMDFRSKPSAPLNSDPKVSSITGGGSGGGGFDDSFGVFQNVNVSKANVDSFGMPPVPEFSSHKPQATSQSKGGIDPLNMLFSSSASSAPATATEGAGGQLFGEASDWDVGAEFGGDDGGGATTELEGLPPPPVGVTASVAKGKGIDNHKQGQFADAIKWLSWASVLLEKSGDKSAITDVLTCRATCYKEVGEYKKAVADCSKVLELDSKNVSVLVQRALLYESTEKYKLGAEDLRAVLKIDPTNRLARTTVHRLTQLAG